MVSCALNTLRCMDHRNCRALLQGTAYRPDGRHATTVLSSPHGILNVAIVLRLYAGNAGTNQTNANARTKN
eukprot:12233246-Karenia_brevis.AAC.1